MDKSVTGIVTVMIHSLLKGNLQEEGDKKVEGLIVALFYRFVEKGKADYCAMNGYD